MNGNSVTVLRTLVPVGPQKDM
ncbi:MAG: hypothetical protein JWP25_1440, partial [Bradyrhizobium sp.]|nr:hypothetical protein [Bradyrhizobium sp.]